MSELYDTTIIGGGPAGLFSAFYSGLRNMKTKIIEYQKQLGGKVLLYPEKMIWDVGAQPPTLGSQFAKNIVQQGLTFNPAVFTGTKVEWIEKDKHGHFLLKTDDGDVHYSKTIILAHGGGIYNPKRLDLRSAPPFENRSLHYTIPSYKPFYQKDVLISGGGDAAIDWANDLVKVANSIKLVYRKQEFSAHEANVTKILNHPKVTAVPNSTIYDLSGEDGQIKEVLLKNEKLNIIETHQADHVIVAHGYDQIDSFEVSDQIKLQKLNEFFLSGNALGCTSEPGIFAAGDNIAYEGKINLLAGAYQDAVNAVNSAKLWINPKANQNAMVSSHNKQFDEKNEQLIKDMFE